MTLRRLLAWAARRLSSNVGTPEVRAEIWRLGTRHHGWPLEGALRELEAPNLPTARAALLRACIRKLKSD
jgi:hypothetical protein